MTPFSGPPFRGYDPLFEAGDERSLAHPDFHLDGVVVSKQRSPVDWPGKLVHIQPDQLNNQFMVHLATPVPDTSRTDCDIVLKRRYLMACRGVFVAITCDQIASLVGIRTDWEMLEQVRVLWNRHGGITVQIRPCCFFVSIVS
ncbi:MAG TPA: hypothetical protein VN541_17170 [Tepidisphaeraceae bacterium]|nr:hypothetical protein [Tepidisphaeraceae bacterium]